MRLYRLGDEPRDDLVGSTTPAERFEMVGVLSRRAWELSGQPAHAIPRSSMTIALKRRS